MAQLRAWLARQFDEHLVEPNSALGEAITYMLKHLGAADALLASAWRAARQ